MEWQLLEGVPAEEVRLLLSVARRRRFARKEVVFHRDDPADSLHLVSKGRFAIQTATPVGDTFMIGIRGAGDTFGEMALVGSHARSATIVALEPSETFSIYEGDFQRLQAQHEAINRALLNFFAREVRALHDRLLEALYVPVERRVIRRLSDLAELYGDGGRHVVVPLTQEMLAELAGTSRETVNRILRDEERRGTLELQRGRTVLDRELLAQRVR
jgi:CRP/FNR family transcriptional regulator, cyclic AMP receptor protein